MQNQNSQNGTQNEGVLNEYQVRTMMRDMVRSGNKTHVIEFANLVFQNPENTPAILFTAADALTSIGEYETALPILQQLASLENGPDRKLALKAQQRVAGILTLGATGEAPLPSPFEGNDSEVQPYWVDGSDTVALIFPGLAQKTAIPLGMLHAMLSKHGVSLVYLRDRERRTIYMRGISALGTDYHSTIDAIRNMLPDNTKRLLCFGTSAGGYAALRYGLDLSADRVLAMGSPTSFSIDIATWEPRARAFGIRLHKDAPEMAQDLRNVYIAAEKRPRVDLWYGADMPLDKRHAEHMRNVPGVHLHKVPGYKQHDVLWQLVGDGKADDVFSEFISASTSDVTVTTA